MERRLAAILSADVVGYSRLMEADEEATIRVLSECRQVIDELIANHHGRVFGSAGDSVIAEFTSAVEAVHCAIEIQRHQEAQDADLSEDRRMRLRIGINLGDIIVDGDNLLGGGVNVAARLESLAEPGGICISGNVFEQVDGKFDQVFTDLGEHRVKNVSKPVRVYGTFDHVKADMSDSHARPFFDVLEDKSVLIKGGCLCGEVRYQINEPSIDTNYCHCRMCQRFSGAPVVAASTFPKDSLVITQGNPKYFETTHEHALFYESSLIAERGFCPNCGSSLFYRPLVRRWTDWIAVFTASLDNPENFGPVWHLGVESQMPWLRIQDDLPQVRCKDSPGLVAAWASVGLEVK